MGCSCWPIFNRRGLAIESGYSCGPIFNKEGANMEKHVGKFSIKRVLIDGVLIERFIKREFTSLHVLIMIDLKKFYRRGR